MTSSLRFLPWARRGLAAALPGGGGDGTPIPAHGTIKIGFDIGDGATRRSVSHVVSTYGPGEVIGIDPSLIIRRSPRAGATDAEPNYLAAIDFGIADLPWLFTPRGPTLGGRLRPWVALVVVEVSDRMSIGNLAGAPLPVLTIESGAGTELHPLDDSWAWAHAQVVHDGNLAPTGGLGDPEASSSRLVCPRRLDEHRSYVACLVPAFRAGVERGLGRTAGDGDLTPAWAGENRVVLPVYDAWRFATGARGDFESLATRIRPHGASGDVGRVSMFVGSMWPGLALDPARTDGIVSMDGALQTPGADAAALDDVPQPVRDAIEAVVETDVERADASDERTSVGPPLYLGAHAGRSAVDDDAPTWFRELNVDPRARAAAGLGAEVVRRNQEDFVHAAWEQVGAADEVNRRLALETLLAEIGRRFVARHMATRSDASVVRFAAPAAARIAVEGAAIPGVVARTSTPDAILDPAMRRLASPNNRHVAKAARRAGIAAPPDLLGHLATGSDRIDPTRFTAIAIDGLAGAVTPAPDASGDVDLSSVGFGVSVSSDVATSLTAALDAGAREPTLTDTELRRLRPDLLSRGVLVDAHLEAVREFNATIRTGRPGTRSTVFELIGRQSEVGDDAVGFVLSASDGGVGIATLRPSGPEHLTVTPASTGSLTGASTPGSVAGAIAAATGGPTVAGRRPAVIATPRTTARSAGRIVRSGPLADVVTSVGVTGPDGDTTAPTDRDASEFVVPGLVKDHAVVAALESAFRRTLSDTGFADAVPAKRLVPLDVGALATAVRERCDPTIRRLRRLNATVTVGSATPTQLVAGPVDQWSITPMLDRVTAAPDLRIATSRSLADVDPARLCPGVGSVPSETVTLLETNPRFVAGFLGGMNHEMNRELLWRGFPTHRRATPFARFWGRTDGTPDISPHDRWDDRALVRQSMAGPPQLVLLVRGDLFQRYPNTLVVAEREGASPRRLPPAFAGRFDPDVAYFGFDLVLDDLRDDPEAWIFAFIEPAGEPRFGFDVTIGDRQPGVPPTSWSDVAWPDVPVAPGDSLRVDHLRALGIEPVINSDTVASGLYQAPFAIEFRAIDLIFGLDDHA